MKKYLEIIKHYESCLEKHGDTHLGVDWPTQADVNKRYKVMLELIKYEQDIENTTLLDFGCGTAHLLEYIINNKYHYIKYSGLDISSKFISICKSKYKGNDFYCGDLLEKDFNLNMFDFVVLNGVFTEKIDMSFDEMWNYFTKLITKVYDLSNKGIAFNVMSKQVDWERDDLFHVPLDLISEFLCKNLSRNFVIRNDYGLYEYTVYIYKKNVDE